VPGVVKKWLRLAGHFIQDIEIEGMGSFSGSWIPLVYQVDKA